MSDRDSICAPVEKPVVINGEAVPGYFATSDGLILSAWTEQIRLLRSGGWKLAAIADQFGIRESTVSRIANGVRRA